MQDKKQTEFNRFRSIYITNLSNNEYPVLPAFYYYLNHTSNKTILDQMSFERMFMKAVTDSIHPISFETSYAVMDIQSILDILNGYYDIRELSDKNGVLIGLI